MIEALVELSKVLPTGERNPSVCEAEFVIDMRRILEVG